MHSVLSGKLRPPPLGDHTLPRVHLLNRLMNEQQRLTLVQSPAGYGKSTLLAQWYNHRVEMNLKTAWVSFDPVDSSALTVLMYIVNALQEAGLDLKALRNFMSNPLHRLTSPEVVITLCGELEKSSENTVLILEDYHFIESSEVDIVLDLLIKRSPENFQLAISSRDFPSLTISALRAQGLLLQLTANELRFVEQEICEFMQLDSTDDTLTLVADQTEGWPIALQLMRLHWLDDRQDSKPPARYGSVREDIADYLAHQVLETLPETCQEFLIDTAFLDRICSDLSNTILGRDDSEQIFEILKSLDGLLDPIDDEHTWYRHHSLLADYLRRLLKRKGKAYLITLHQRACEWFADNDLALDAIEHAVRAGDIELTATLFEKVGGPNLGWQQGFELLQQILSSIPDDWIDQNPSLKIGKAMIFANEGDIDQAKKLLAEAKATESYTPSPNFLRYARTLRLILVGYVDYPSLEAEIEETERACEEVSGSDLWLHGWVYCSLWLLYFRRGKFSAARMAALTAVDKLGRAQAFYSEYHASLDLGIISMACGRLNDALRYYGRAGELTRQHLASDASLMKLVQLLTAGVHYQRNEMDTAYAFLDCASDQLGHLSIQSEVCINSYTTAVSIVFTRDGLDPALALLELADDFASRRRMVPLQWLVILLRVELLTRAGELQQAQQVVRDNPQVTQFRQLYEQKEIGWRECQVATLVLSRLYLYLGKPKQALVVLNTIQPGEMAADRLPFRIELHTLKAEVLAELGEQQEALTLLSKGLDEAMKENLIRALLNEGKRIIPLLKLLLRNINTLKTDLRLTEFTLDIIRQIEEKLQKPSSLFTPREDEILDKITEGRPNKVIAGDLGISESTVKFHLANIYVKLGVHNRTQAVSAARSRKKVVPIPNL